MPLQLLIRLGLKNQDPAEAWIVDEEQAELQVTTEAALDQIPPTQKTIVLLDARLVRITQVVLPQASRAQLLKALPFALEEAIVHPLESTHFALGVSQADGSPVAIIEKARLVEIIQALESAHRQAAPIYSEIQAVPLAQDAWTLLAEADSVLVRTGFFRGFRCSYAELMSLLKIVMQQTTLPQQIDLYLTPKHLLEITSLQSLFAHAHIHQHEIRDPLAIFCDTLRRPPAPLLDIRQGEFQSSHLFRMTVWWRLAIAALTCNILFAGSLYAGEYYLLQQKNQQLTEHIAEQYHRVFPNADSVVSPDTRVQQQLQILKTEATGSTWHQLMSASMTALSHFDSVECTEIHFNNAKLILQLKADDIASLTQWVKEVEHKGIQVTQEKSVNTDKSITAKMTLQGKSA